VGDYNGTDLYAGSDNGTYHYKFHVNDSFTGMNTSAGTGELEKDTITIFATACDNCQVPRNGSVVTLIEYSLNDTDRGTLVTFSVNCDLNVTMTGGGSGSTDSFSNTTSSGYCRRYFNPDCSYYLGPQDWFGSVAESTYYFAGSISAELDVVGQFYHRIQIPDGENYLEGDNITIRGNATDDCGQIRNGITTIGFYMINEENVSQCTPVNGEGSGGWYNCIWDSWGRKPGYYNITMNSSNMLQPDSTPIYYGGIRTKVNAMFLEAANAMGDVLMIPDQTTVNGVTKVTSKKFSIQIILNNTGYANLYNTTMSNYSMPAGWNLNPVSYDCGNVPIGGNCTTTFNVTVPNATMAGIYNVSMRADWSNKRGMNISKINWTIANVSANYDLEVVENALQGFAIVGKTTTVGNITLDANCSGNLTNITFQKISGFCLDPTDERNVTFIPNFVSNLAGGTSLVVDVNITVETGADIKTDPCAVRVNATGSKCPGTECWDNVILNITTVNGPPDITNATVTNSTDGWGATYNYTVKVFDHNFDNVNITLWINNSGTWEKRETRNVTYNTLVNWTYASFATTDIGENMTYLFEYEDPKNNITNTTEYSGPSIERDDLLIQVTLNSTDNVSRNTGGFVFLEVLATDADRGGANIGSGRNCTFWSSLNGMSFALVSNNTTDANGYCGYILQDIDCNYSAGNQIWTAGFGDTLYKPSNSSQANFSVIGFTVHNITFPNGGYFYETQQIVFRGNSTDECIRPSVGIDMDFFAINGTEFNCSQDNDEGNGYYNCSWNSTGKPIGWYDMNMNSSNSSSYFGNETFKFSAFFLQNRTLSARVEIDPTSFVTDNITYNTSVVFNVTVNMTNTETGYMTNARLSPSYVPPGWTVIPGLYSCGTMWLDDYCSNSFQVNVPNGSYPSTYSVNFTAYWTNPDSSAGSHRNTTTVTINSPTEIDIIYPTGANKTVEIVSNQSIPIAVNVTSKGKTQGTNITFEVRFNNTLCPVNYSSYSNVTGTWLLTCSAPDIEDAEFYNVMVNVTNTIDFTIAMDYETAAVFYKDVSAPVFVNVTSGYVFVNQTASALSFITDKTNVEKVNLTLYRTGYNASVYQMQNLTDKTEATHWNMVFPVLPAGDYDYTMSANDTNNNTGNRSWWFAVYQNQTVKINGTLIDQEFQPVLSNFGLFRNNRSLSNAYMIHNFSTNASGHYSYDVFKRTYDFRWNAIPHTIDLLGVSITRNYSNPLKMDDIQLKYLSIPLTRRVLVGFAANTTFNISGANITMNFTGTNYEINFMDAIRVYRCPVWDWNSLECNSTWVNLGGTVDVNEETVTAYTGQFSAFAAAEEVVCGNSICENEYGEAYSNCPADCWAPSPPDEGGDEGSPGGYTGGAITKSVCGNLKCEIGENSQNCPEDCPPEEKDEDPFSVDTDVIDVELLPGESRTYIMSIANKLDEETYVTIDVTGKIWELTKLETSSLTIPNRSTANIRINFFALSSTPTGVYSGELDVMIGDKLKKVPVTIRVVTEKEALMDVKVEVLTKMVEKNETVRYHVSLFNLGYNKKFDVHLTHNIRDVRTGKLLAYKEEEMALETTLSFIKTFPLYDINIYPGKFYVEVVATYENRTASSADMFEVVEPLLTPERILLIIFIVAIIIALVVGWKGSKFYRRWRQRKMRYLFPVDYSKLPKGQIYLGKIAETGTKAYFDHNDLTTHILSAGATGSGKTVSAMVVVEDILKMKIPVIVFDPTGQWTGFVKRCTDKNMLDRYDEFGLKEEDARPFKGMIYEVTDPKTKINFKEYMNPSEITVFTLNKLKPGQFDEAVQNIVQTIFETQWEESPELRMLVIFDEVHRLLEKYGGKGGYVALERGCREFRKWGIGMMMLSQVLADFKEAIKGNVLTEFQLHTKGLGDIDRVKKKYGEEYANRITKQEVGVGMVQNPKYNRGRPYFVAFRPLLHSPHKIPEEDLQKYLRFAEELKDIKRQIASLERKKIDTSDITLELNLAMDKLKTGAFRMTEIYLEGLRESLKKYEKKKQEAGKKKKK
ncbi:MAG: DUF853 family protein, partial [Candidatus Aenigmarchaeota archaeon]|nr:DUF853 family protein [Candidatus Aenigmarchaeota archaeon]